MIKTKNLSIYAGKKQILKEINLEIKSGEIICLVGENGLGKTSLIEALLGLSTRCEGEISRSFNESEFSYLPQVSSQFPKIYLQLKDISTNEKSFYPCSLFEKNWHTSSGGERKKALISRTIDHAVKLIVLDEPFNHLDLNSRGLVTKSLIELSKQGLTIIYTGHDHFIPNSQYYEVSKWRS